jgi:hypothetical protein
MKTSGLMGLNIDLKHENAKIYVQSKSTHACIALKL